MNMFDKIVLLASIIAGAMFGVFIAAAIDLFVTVGWMIGLAIAVIVVLAVIVSQWISTRENRFIVKMVGKLFNHDVDNVSLEDQPKLPSLSTGTALLLGIPVGVLAAIIWTPATLSAIIPF
ncbi:MAG: hypothetical protein ACI9TA_002416 [Reinekea sp.]|jgi:hypothetical protein